MGEGKNYMELTVFIKILWLNKFCEKSFGALDVPVGVNDLSLFLLDQMEDLAYLILADYQVEDLLSF